MSMCSAPNPPLAYPRSDMRPTWCMASTRGRITSSRNDSWLHVAESASHEGRWKPSSRMIAALLLWKRFGVRV